MMLLASCKMHLSKLQLSPQKPFSGRRGILERAFVALTSLSCYTTLLSDFMFLREYTEGLLC